MLIKQIGKLMQCATHHLIRFTWRANDNESKIVRRIRICDVGERDRENEKKIAHAISTSLLLVCRKREKNATSRKKIAMDKTKKHILKSLIQ